MEKLAKPPKTRANSFSNEYIVIGPYLPSEYNFATACCKHTMKSAYDQRNAKKRAQWKPQPHVTNLIKTYYTNTRTWNSVYANTGRTYDANEGSRVEQKVAYAYRTRDKQCAFVFDCISRAQMMPPSSTCEFIIIIIKSIVVFACKFYSPALRNRFSTAATTNGVDIAQLQSQRALPPPPATSPLPFHIHIAAKHMHMQAVRSAKKTHLLVWSALTIPITTLRK